MATAAWRSNFRAGLRSRTLGEHLKIIAGKRSRTLLNASVAFEHFDTERRQGCATASPPARCGGNDRLSECLIDAVQQQPCALVRHVHVAGGGRDRASVA